MKHGFLAALLVALAGVTGLQTLEAQSKGTSLGSIRLRQAVMAGDQRLAPGTYQVRLTGEQLDPATGQSPQAEQWVELLSGGQVRAKVAASVIPDSEIGEIAKGPRPAKGSYRVDLLKGNEYVRVWINRGGSNYLIHLPPAA